MGPDRMALEHCHLTVRFKGSAFLSVVLILAMAVHSTGRGLKGGSDWSGISQGQRQSLPHRRLLQSEGNFTSDSTTNSTVNSTASTCLEACRGNSWETLGLFSTHPTCACVQPLELVLELSNGTALQRNGEFFLQELSTQLNLTRNETTKQLVYEALENNGQLVNVTLWILPLTGTQVSSAKRQAIRRALANEKVELPDLFESYRFISLEQLAPPPPPPPAPAPPPLPSSPPSPPPTPASPPPPSSKGGGGLNLAVIGGIAAGIAVALAVAICTLWVVCWRHRSDEKDLDDYNKMMASSASLSAKGVPTAHKPSTSREATSVPRPMSTRVFCYEELIEATASFDISTLLGEGGFGRVYRGKLKDGTEVAIKKLTNGGHQGDREFLVEVEMLSRLHHRHLVKLIGYYASRDSKHQLLCYELVPNGTLEYWLHGNLGDKPTLDWNLRMKVAIGAARGLAYLHEDSQPCVIHRDFKASNILLTYDFNAKVADFGLAKQAPEVQGGYVSTRVMGTFGYVAPEYAMTGHLLVKSDVYSFGVVLLELLSGRKPVDMAQPTGEENLVTWARPLLQQRERHFELVDPRLRGDYPPEDFAHVAAIASACVSQDIVHRPTMGEVVQSLKLVQRESEYHSGEGIEGKLVASPGLSSYADVSTGQFSAGWPSGLRTMGAGVGEGGSEHSFTSTAGSGALLFSNHLSSTAKSREMRAENVLTSEDLDEGR